MVTDRFFFFFFFFFFFAKDHYLTFLNYSLPFSPESSSTASSFSQKTGELIIIGNGYSGTIEFDVSAYSFSDPNQLVFFSSLLPSVSFLNIYFSCRFQCGSPTQAGVLRGINKEWG